MGSEMCIRDSIFLLLFLLSYPFLFSSVSFSVTPCMSLVLSQPSVRYRRPRCVALTFIANKLKAFCSIYSLLVLFRFAPLPSKIKCEDHSSLSSLQKLKLMETRAGDMEISLRKTQGELDGVRATETQHLTQIRELERQLEDAKNQTADVQRSERLTRVDLQEASKKVRRR